MRHWNSLAAVCLPFATLIADQGGMPNPPAPMANPPRMANASGRPQVKGGLNLFVTADYLIWQATEENLTYCENAQLDTSASVPQGQFFTPKFNWESGVKVALGYNIGHDQWDTNLVWTWFEDSSKGRASANSVNPLLYSSVTTPELSVTSSQANSSWTVHLNVIDWQLGREFYAGKWLTLRPYAALRTSWVNQNWNSSFSGIVSYHTDDIFLDNSGSVFSFASTSTAPSSVSVALKQKFWGIGALGGLDTEWGLTRGLSFYGNGALSLLYGFFQDYRTESSVASSVSTTNLNVKTSRRTEQPIAELHLGLRWDQMFANDHCHFRIQAGWDHMVFFDHNRFPFYTDGLSSVVDEYGGNLAFQGWSASVRLDF